MINILEQTGREYQITRFVSNNFPLKSCSLWDDVEKLGKTGQDTIQYNMALGFCMLNY
jgi:hypothetical protein